MIRSKHINALRRRKTSFCRMRSDKDLAALVGVEAYRLWLLIKQPHYRVFSIPKKDGNKRWIEDPEPRLKTIQDRLNDFLQAVYFFHRTPASFGFQIGVNKDPTPRNILTNAQYHLGNEYLFKADLKDFFHQVKSNRLHELFQAKPFAFDEELTQLIVSLCTHQGRLPMGAPTSPVLSNFAAIQLDLDLLQLTDWADWRYTRFADDMSFSSSTPFPQGAKSKIEKIAVENGFEFNPKKFKNYGPGDERIITGLRLGANEVEIPSAFLQQLDRELEKLDHVTDLQYWAGQHVDWIEKFADQVEGKVNFIQFALGENDPISIQYQERLEQAEEPSDYYGPISWMDFNYF